MKGPVEPVHRSVPETIQEVIELTGFLCFLFRSTPSSQPGVIVAWRDMLRSVQVLGHYRYRLLDFCSLGSFDRSIV